MSNIVVLTQLCSKLFNRNKQLIADPLPALKRINPSIETIKEFYSIVRKV